MPFLMVNIMMRWDFNITNGFSMKTTICMHIVFKVNTVVSIMKCFFRFLENLQQKKKRIKYNIYIINWEVLYHYVISDINNIPKLYEWYERY